MLKTAASKMALAIRTACVVFVLAVVLVGCSGADAGSGTQEEQAKAAPPKAEDDHATTSEGREVMIEMVANDSGKDLEIDRVKPGNTHGDIICDADIEAGRILSCAYTPVKGFTGKEEFPYVVKDASGKTDSAMVYVTVKPAE